MNDPLRDTETLLASLEPPGPPDALRERVLHHAGAALDRPGTRDLWTRIYVSRPLRAAWAVAVLGLIAGNLLLPKADRRLGKDGLTQETARRLPELREVVDVPRLSEDYVSIDGSAYRRPAVAVPAPAGSSKKEKIS